jgi:hypothetical protein
MTVLLDSSTLIAAMLPDHVHHIFEQRGENPERH